MKKTHIVEDCFQDALEELGPEEDVARPYINSIDICGEDNIFYGTEGQMCYIDMELDIHQQDVLLVDTHE